MRQPISQLQDTTKEGSNPPSLSLSLSHARLLSWFAHKVCFKDLQQQLLLLHFPLPTLSIYISSSAALILVVFLSQFALTENLFLSILFVFCSCSSVLLLALFVWFVASRLRGVVALGVVFFPSWVAVSSSPFFALSLLFSSLLFSSPLDVFVFVFDFLLLELLLLVLLFGGDVFCTEASTFFTFDFLSWFSYDFLLTRRTYSCRCCCVFFNEILVFRRILSSCFLTVNFSQGRRDVIGRSRTSHTQSRGSVEECQTRRFASTMWVWRRRGWTSSPSAYIWSAGRKRTFLVKLWKQLGLLATSTWPSMLARMRSTCVSECTLSMCCGSTKCCRVLELIACRPAWGERLASHRVFVLGLQ